MLAEERSLSFALDDYAARLPCRNLGGKTASAACRCGLAGFYLTSLALGALIVSFHGSNSDLLHVLFGTILAIDAVALCLVGGIASLTLVILAAVYRPLVVECFDPGSCALWPSVSGSIICCFCSWS